MNTFYTGTLFNKTQSVMPWNNKDKITKIIHPKFRSFLNETSLLQSKTHE